MTDSNTVYLQVYKVSYLQIILCNGIRWYALTCMVNVNLFIVLLLYSHPLACMHSAALLTYTCQVMKGLMRAIFQVDSMPTHTQYYVIKSNCCLLSSHGRTILHSIQTLMMDSLFIERASLRRGVGQVHEIRYIGLLCSRYVTTHVILCTCSVLSWGVTCLVLGFLTGECFGCFHLSDQSDQSVRSLAFTVSSKRSVATYKPHRSI